MRVWKEQGEPDAPSPEVVLPQGVAYRFESGALRVTLPLDVYGLDAIFRSCYWLTDRCYVYLAPPAKGLLEVNLVAKEGGVSLTDQLIWKFLNNLIDQRLRIDIGRETRAIREMIVAQAFAETDLIDDRGRVITETPIGKSGSIEEDPEALSKWNLAS